MGADIPATNSRIARPLNTAEWSFRLLERFVPMNCLVLAEVAGPLDVDVLRRAMDAVQQRHPLLRTRLVDGRWNRCCFEDFEGVELPLRVVDCALDKWVIEAERELGTPFSLSRGPLGRCTLIRKNPDRWAVMFTFHHIIGDAQGGGRVLMDIMQVAGAILEGKLIELPVRASTGGMLRRMPSGARGARGFGRYLRFALADGWRNRSFGGARPLAVDERIPTAARQTRILARRLESPVITALQARARRESTTLHGILAAAQLQGVAGEFQLPGEIRLAISSTINLRRRLDPVVDDQELGLYSSIMDTVHAAGESLSIWDVARDVRQRMRQCVRVRHPSMLAYDKILKTAILRKLVPLTERNVARLDRYFTTRDIAPSIISMPPAVPKMVFGPLEITSACGVVSQPRSPWASLASVVYGHLRWNFIHHSPSMGSDRAGRLADRIILALERAIEE